MRATGKFLAYILRHNPSAVNISLDEYGWANVAKLIKGVCSTGRQLDLTTLENIVATDGKQRFAFNDDHSKIRANQGHSLSVDAQMAECRPPTVLYHGTAEKYLDGIKANGIEKRTRNYVHLSKDIVTAVKVGSRHGNAVVLVINTQQMYLDGYKFLLSANGVWQTECVPFRYVIEIIGS